MTASDPQIILHVQTGESDSRHCVLILDDEPAIQFAYRRIIEGEGMQVDSSASLSEAIACINAKQYLAVIADVRLSGSENRDGLEFLRIVRKTQPSARMILATGYGSSEIRIVARDLGADHYFIKPVPPASIISALKGFTNTAPVVPS